jgi:hypothetical protein
MLGPAKELGQLGQLGHGERKQNRGQWRWAAREKARKVGPQSEFPPRKLEGK